MPWIEKARPTAFDNLPIYGLLFLDGDMFVQMLEQQAQKLGITDAINRSGHEGYKHPTVFFSPHAEFPLVIKNHQVCVELYPGMELPYFHTRDEAFQYVIQEKRHQNVITWDKDQLSLWRKKQDENLVITYDNEQQRMIDVFCIYSGSLAESKLIPLQTNLLPDEIRQKLPPLFGGEKLVDKALAQVKLFIPDENLVWYVSEFDGEDICFGLEVGIGVRLAYFSLANLQSLRGLKGYPVERDIHFQPRTLEELKNLHEDERPY